jgi:hypothetical protein
MHLSILRQAQNNTIKRAMFEDVIINLVSSLEAIAHVLNQVYDINFEYHDVKLDHIFPKDKERHHKRSQLCLRCRLAKSNPPLADLLAEVLKTGSPVEQWYQALIEYRHQIVHRPHFIAMVLAGFRGYYLPDDPRIIKPTERLYVDKKTKQTIWPNYTQRREIKKFTELSYKIVVDIVEAIYQSIRI